MTIYENVKQIYTLHQTLNQDLNDAQHRDLNYNIIGNGIDLRGSSDDDTLNILPDPIVANRVMNPNYPIENVQRANSTLSAAFLNAFNDHAQNQTSEIYNDAPEDKKKNALLYFDPSNTDTDVAKGHMTQRTLLKLSDDNFGPGEKKNALEIIRNEVEEYFNESYKEGKDDTDYVKTQKDLIRGLFIGLHNDLELKAQRYAKINETNIAAFEDLDNNACNGYFDTVKPNDKGTLEQIVKSLF